MNSRNKLITLFKNVSYTITSNVISLIISLLVVLIIPKFIGVNDYGYWQLYVFYSSYIGFLHFGWNDGLYLRLGGATYERLDKPTYYSQFYLLSFSQVLLAIIGSIIIFTIDIEYSKKYVLYMTALCMVVTNVRYMLLYLLQATDKIKQYSTITISDRIFYILIIVALLLGQIKDFKYMIWADILGKLFSLIYAIYVCRDIVFLSIKEFKININEVIENVQVGIKLMFSNIASKLIVGNVRFGIEHIWSIAVFGKLSLTLSISNFMMIFINAISLVLFPFLRKVEQANLNSIYNSLRNILMIILFGILILYFPLIKILEIWLPKYQDSLKYMAILFPMCLYEGKMSLLISTYLKVLRKEKLLLKINIITLILSIILSVLSILLLKNLNFAVLTILVLVSFRCIIAELFLQNIIKVKLFIDIVYESILTILFISVSWYLDFYSAILSYLLGYCLYIILKRKNLKETIILIKEKFKK